MLSPHIFESVTLICFGCSSPFAIAKTIRTKTVEAKSLVFISRRLGKKTDSPDDEDTSGRPVGVMGFYLLAIGDQGFRKQRESVCGNCRIAVCCHPWGWLGADMCFYEPYRGHPVKPVEFVDEMGLIAIPQLGGQTRQILIRVAIQRFDRFLVTDHSFE